MNLLDYHDDASRVTNSEIYSNCTTDGRPITATSTQKTRKEKNALGQIHYLVCRA